MKKHEWQMVDKVNTWTKVIFGLFYGWAFTK